MNQSPGCVEAEAPSCPGDSWVEVMERVGSGWGWTITCQQKPPNRIVPSLKLLLLGESAPLVTSHNTWV